jgi:hypothetical protein
LFIIFVTVTAALGVLTYLLRRSRLANIALLFFSLSLCVTGLEAYYRFFYAESDGFGRLSKNFNDRYYRFDAYGLRASNLPPSETQANLVVVGDSHVFGAGLKSTSERFSEILAAQYPELHVINLGLPGWDTKTETAQITKYLGDTHAAIPLVVLTYFFNDIEEDVTAADRQRLLPPTPPVEPTAVDRALQRLSNYSRFLELFYYRIGYPRLVRDRLDQIQTFYQDPGIMAAHLASLEQFRSVVEKQYGAHLLIVVLPFLHSEELLHQTKFYERFGRALDDHRFNYLDMQPIFARHTVRELWVSRFDPHTNGFANQLVANEIIDYLAVHPDEIQRKIRAQPVAP